MLAARRRGVAPYARRPKPNRGQKNVFKPVPSPVGGWNQRDAEDEMAPDEALVLTNFFPGQGSVVLRGGHASHATGLGGAVETVGEFNAGSTRKMFAAANNNIWDTTAAGAASSLAAGFTSNRWQWAQFDDASGGARVGLVNGSDDPQIHNGSAVSAMTISGSNLTPANLNGIAIHKSRSYFWDNRTQDFWYSAVNALGGALTKFPLGRVTGTGGNLVAMGSWSRDGGSGPLALAVFVLSSGDVVVYNGDNPGDATAWALVGIYKVGAPLGTRAILQVGAELVLVTVDGYVPLSKVMAQGRSRAQDAISDKIRKAALFAAKNYAANFGWQAIHYPIANMAIFNIPIASSTFEQHVVNTLTGAWCKFTGMNARSWGMFNDRLYFGGSGVVYKADSGRSDAGTAISAVGQIAWNYLGAPSRKKWMRSVRHLLKVDGSINYSAGVGVDFGVINLEQTESSPVGSTSPWDTSPWDTSPWSDEYTINTDWSAAEGEGYNVSARLEVVTSTRSVEWLSTQYLYEPGRGSF
jgi:hypothetical protein